MRLEELKQGLWGYKKDAVFQYISQLEDAFSQKMTARDAQVERIIQQEQEDTTDLSAPKASEGAKESSLYDELMELSGRKAPAAAPAEEDEDDVVEEPTRRIDFDNLQFGKDYALR